jgi:methionyl-tRNA formyltransferase
MRVAFAGTPEFALVALQAIVGAGFVVPLVLTQPDRPAGRGMKLRPSPVKQFAAAQGLPLAQPRGLRLDGRFADDASAAGDALRAAAPDVLVVAAYGLILPPWVLALPPRGCLNIHASLLPRWRGAAPIQRAIEAGDGETGVTIMQMDAGLDTGAMLLQRRLPIADDETGSTLHDKLAGLGAGLVVQALRQIDQLQATPQPAHGASYAPKIGKAEGAVDWALSAATIERRLRAFDPFPGCTFELDGEAVKVWRARLARGQGRPGTVLPADDGRLVVACGEGALELLELQRTGGRRVAAADFLRGHPVAAGQVLAALVRD